MHTNKNPNTHTLKSYLFCRLAKGGLQLRTTLRVPLFVPHINLTLNIAASRSHMIQRASLKGEAPCSKEILSSSWSSLCYGKAKTISKESTLPPSYFPGDQRPSASASGEVSCCRCMPTVHSKPLKFASLKQSSLRFWEIWELII